MISAQSYSNSIGTEISQLYNWDISILQFIIHTITIRKKIIS